MTHRKMALGYCLAALYLGIGSIAYAQAPVKTAISASAEILANPQQIAFERQVLRVLESAPMKAEIRRVEALYAADPQGKTATGKATIKRAAHSIAVAAAQYAVGEDTDRPGIFWTVNAPHQWAGLKVPRSGYGIDNPDNVYRNMMFDGAVRYEIRGKVNRPGPAEVHFEMRDSIPGTGDMAAEGGKQVATLRMDQMEISPDGSFTITADSQPANGRPNHLQMPAQGKFLTVVRDLFTDWGNQKPVSLEAHRVGGPPITPQRSEQEVVNRAAKLLSQLAPYWVNYNNRYIYSRPLNQLGAARIRPGGRGLSTSGHFQLGANEAWVITLDALDALSLGVQLSDPWGVAYEYADRTSSLNNMQAKPNADGTYTFVVSQRDPGVYNWLDPEGHAAGMLAIRWQTVPDGYKAENAIRSVKLVPIGRLKDELAPETVFVTAKERAAQRAERAATYANRLAPAAADTAWNTLGTPKQIERENWRFRYWIRRRYATRSRA